MSEGFAMVNFASEERTTSKKSDLARVEVAELLGCERMGARVWYLQPGESIAYHKQKTQEELYIPLARDGRMRIDGEILDVPKGAAILVSPATPRQMINTDDVEHEWLVIGAPPREDDGIRVEDSADD